VEFVGPPAPTRTQEAIVVLDTSRDYVSDKLIGMVRGVDRFFGSNLNFQETNDSVFQLDMTRVLGYTGTDGVDYSLRAKVRLPNTERNLHLLIETNPDANTTAEPKRNQSAIPATGKARTSYGAGVRFDRKKENRWQFSTDGGLKFQGLSTTPFARARASYAAPLGEWQLRAAETVFWFNTIGVGETTQFDFDHSISEPLLFRASSNATWMRSSLNFDLRQDFSFFHTVNERTAMLYQISAIGISRPSSHVNDYVALVLYRYRLHRDWVFFELSPQVHFPRERNYRSSEMLMLRLEFLFDKPK
jgi:hypothetical protein